MTLFAHLLRGKDEIKEFWNEHLEIVYAVLKDFNSHVLNEGWQLGTDAKPPRFCKNQLPDPCFCIKQRKSVGRSEIWFSVKLDTKSKRPTIKVSYVRMHYGKNTIDNFLIDQEADPRTSFKEKLVAVLTEIYSRFLE